jgi:hypothetical protein
VRINASTSKCEAVADERDPDGAVLGY